MNSKTAYFLSIIAYVIIVGGLIAIFARMTVNRANSHRENTQSLVTNCILSVPATSRTHENIENCYKTVEKANNVTIPRFYTVNE